MVQCDDPYSGTRLLAWLGKARATRGHGIFGKPLQFQPNHCPWTIRRCQLPLRLAYAMAFNSCQGLTHNKVVLDFRAEVFAHIQLYTSVSRVHHRGAYGKLMSERDLSGDVVYRELYCQCYTPTGAITEHHSEVTCVESHVTPGE